MSSLPMILRPRLRPYHATSHDTAALPPSEGTVRNYLSTAIRKLGARNRREAIEVANEKGWL
jgi:hypothetical protein